MVQRPDSGFGVKRATLGKGPAGAQASPGSGGEGETDADAAKVAPCWCTTVMAVTCRSWIGCWRS